MKISINEVALDAKLSLTSAAGEIASGEGSLIAGILLLGKKLQRKTMKKKLQILMQMSQQKKLLIRWEVIQIF